MLKIIELANNKATLKLIPFVKKEMLVQSMLKQENLYYKHYYLFFHIDFFNINKNQITLKILKLFNFFYMPRCSFLIGVLFLIQLNFRSIHLCLNFL